MVIAPVVLLLCSVLDLSLYQKDRMRGHGLQELALFPAGRLIKSVVLGYDNFFADIYWMQSIQYIGEHFATNRKFPLLYHIYDVVTRLDPGFIDAYNFGAFIIATYSRDPQSAMGLLKLGMERNPDRWQIPFQAGFISFAYYGNIKQAIHYFKRASTLPGHPSYIDQYIAFLDEKQGDLHLSLTMWKDLYDNTEVPLTRTICAYNILRLDIKIEEGKLREAVERFTKDRHRLPYSLHTLVRLGYIDSYASVLPWKSFGYVPATGRILAPRLTWQDVGRFMSLKKRALPW